MLACCFALALANVDRSHGDFFFCCLSQVNFLIIQNSKLRRFRPSVVKRTRLFCHIGTVLTSNTDFMEGCLHI